MTPRHEINTAKVVATLGLPLVAIFALVAWSTLSAWSRLDTLTSSPVRYAASAHALNTMTILAAACLVVLLALFAILFRSLTKTQIGDVEISKPGLFRSTRLKWTEIVRVQRYRNGSIRLQGPSGFVFIPVNYYRQPQELLAFIDGKLNRTAKGLL